MPALEPRHAGVLILQEADVAVLHHRAAEGLQVKINSKVPREKKKEKKFPEVTVRATNEKGIGKSFPSERV